MSGNVVSFCRYLRSHGFLIGIAEETAALQALILINPGNRQCFKRALQATLCKSQKGYVQFDVLFDQYFYELKCATDSKIKKHQHQRDKGRAGEISFQSLKRWLSGNRNTEESLMAAYSPEAGLARQDFGAVSGEDVEALQQVIKSLSARMLRRVKRRYTFTGKGNFPDLRATMRKNLRMGGELIDLVFKEQRKRRQRLIILCDMSRSMELYSSFFLQFMYAFCKSFKRTEVFTFNTSLNRITAQIKQSSFEDVKQVIAADKTVFGGGTKIGEAIKSLMANYGHKLDKARSRVMVVSDGWDQGDPDLIRQSMERLRHKTDRIIWLNPLAGYAGYRPETEGMKAALPYIDVFAPVHNVETLGKMVRWI